jgi:uncharacterized protein YjbI with pentapeptide repeats
MFSTVAIAIVGVALLVATVIPGIRLYWPQRGDPVSRTDLGVALMTGAFIAFAVLGLQLMIQIRSQLDSNRRDTEAERQSLLLLLGRSRDLSGLDLHGKDLRGAYLNAKILRGANLAHADLRKALLQGTNLMAADLEGSNLAGAHLERADLRQADLVGANLQGAKLNNARLDTAVFYGEKGGDDVVADLRGADLSNAWASADLRHADLRKATLVGTRLAPANLQGARLNSADLTYADLRGADLRGANLRFAELGRTKDLSHARYDTTTRWPDDFYWPGLKDSCEEGCTLDQGPTAPHDFPPELRAIRKALVRAAKTGACIPGWHLEDRPTDIEAVAPNRMASFQIKSWTKVRQSPARVFASTFSETQRPRRRLIPHIRVLKSGRPAWAAVFEGPPRRGARTELEVYFTQDTGSQWLGYRVRAAAPAAMFPLYERDFLKFLKAVGVEGPFFSTLRKSTCHAS